MQSAAVSRMRQEELLRNTESISMNLNLFQDMTASAGEALGIKSDARRMFMSRMRIKALSFGPILTTEHDFGLLLLVTDLASVI